MKVTLKVIKGPDTGKIFEFDQPDNFLVGRFSDAHLRLSDEDPYVGRRHFLLEIAPPRVFLKDLDSKNKPRVNGIVKLEEELNDGDIVEVGYTQLKVTISKEVVEDRTVYCIRCGGALGFGVTGDIPPPEYAGYCISCYLKLAEQQNKAVKSKPHSINCSCGKDLTDQANSDGKAGELEGIVGYYCPKCVRTLKKGKDAGKKIDAYQVIGTLGEGGMGKVYRVYHEPTARVLALKQMLKLTNKELNQRFEREIRALRELVHPNTIRFIDSGVTDEGPYLVTEMASHGNLDGLLSAGKEYLAPQEAVYYISESLKGLEFVHRNKYIHRDLKPENILLQQGENGKLIPKITDFGLAKKFSEAGGSLLTKLGVCMGTIMFMPPEQIKDTGSIQEPADLYAMGVTLYYLLTGRYSFHFPTPLEIERFFMDQVNKARNKDEALAQLLQVQKIKSPPAIILGEEPIPVRDRKPDLPVKLAKVVDKAVKKEIKERFQTAAEFRQALMESI